MDNNTKKKVDELIEAIEKQAVISRSDNRLLQAIEYWERANGAKTKTKRGSRGSELYKKYAQEERQESMFRGNMQDAIKAREEALAKSKEEQEEELAEEVEASRDVKEESEDDKQVLANSEEKPKRKRRTTRKKTDDK